MIKVLIVDDSAFFRNALRRMLADDAEIEVIGIAKDGDEALEQIRALRPDVVTLDVEMPKRDGLSTLKVIMAEMPCPVIMVSSLTQEGAEATLKALEVGAMDFIPKSPPNSARLDLVRLSTDLCARIHAVAQRARRFPLRARTAPAYSSPRAVRTTPSFGATASGASAAVRHGTGRQTREYVAIGVSTGGPPAVQKTLAALPADFPACIFIAQHMPGTFTGPFAKRLDGVSALSVKEAATGDPIRPGLAYVAPGGKHLRVDMRAGRPQLSVVAEPAEALYKPSVNVLMDSIGNAVGSRTVGVTMTGMGSDGVEGSKVLKAKGGYILAQNEASCVVYGMPKAVVEAGLADEVVDGSQMADAIVAALYK